ncbi:SDR family oxidoreductase [Bradyrhizobium viridifuturi]|nr:SDR family oxidoreductase [Bradyrhizobium viridifuturi]MBR1074947.1 SDR family oxidoreductase [Bradyrhizobium viridifuturi]
MIDINLWAAAHASRGSAKHGEERICHVVNISLDAGRVGSWGEAVYSACKGSIFSFTKTVTRDLARRRVQLNAVAAGPRTPRFSQHLPRAKPVRK